MYLSHKLQIFFTIDKDTKFFVHILMFITTEFPERGVQNHCPNKKKRKGRIHPLFFTEPSIFLLRKYPVAIEVL